MLEKYPKEVKLVFKNFPLQMHAFARPAAEFSIAAHKQGKFWEAHDAIFENYNKLSEATLQEIAGQIGLDAEQLDRDLKDPATAASVEADMKDGSAAGVRGTPAIFINGRLLRNRSLQGFQEIIDGLLK